MTQEALQESSRKNQRINKGKREAASATEEAAETKVSSTLIEFPGASRAVPEWRRQLSQRVREVQERKAREAAEELAAAQAAGTLSCEMPSGQLEFVPDLDQPVNPIVSKALERLERARRFEVTTPRLTAVAAAPARTPIIETAPDIIEEIPPIKESIASADAPLASTEERKLSIVASSMPLLAQLSPEESEPARPARERRPVRVISEDDVALSYLESCLSVPALEADTRRDLPGFGRRVTAGAFDLVFIALMVSPAVAAVYYSGRDRKSVV